MSDRCALHETLMVICDALSELSPTSAAIQVHLQDRISYHREQIELINSQAVIKDD